MGERACNKVEQNGMHFLLILMAWESPPRSIEEEGEKDGRRDIQEMRGARDGEHVVFKYKRHEALMERH